MKVDVNRPLPWRANFPHGPFTWTKKKRLSEDRNTMTVYLGPPRTCKSGSASSDGENCSVNRPYRAKDITFLPYDYIDGIRQAEPGDEKQFDEPGAEWGNRQFATIENKMLNATHVTFGSKLINVDWAVPVLKMQDVQARMLINYIFIFRDTGPRGIAKFYKNWVNAYTGKVGRTGLGTCWWSEPWQGRPEEKKEYLEMKAQYQDKSYAKYYAEFAKADDEFGGLAGDINARIQKAIEAIKKDPTRYHNSAGRVDRDQVRREFRLPSGDARYVANLFNRGDPRTAV